MLKCDDSHWDKGQNQHKLTLAGCGREVRDWGTGKIELTQVSQCTIITADQCLYTRPAMPRLA